MQPTIKFMGVYSVEAASKGQGKQKDLFFVWQVRNNDQLHIHVQEIDKTYRPKSKIYVVDNSTFTYFTFEPSIVAMPQARTEEILGPKAFAETASDPSEVKADKVKRDDFDEDFWRFGKTKQKEEAPKQAKPDDKAQEMAQIQVEKVLRNDFDEAIKQLKQPHSRRGALRFIKTIPEQKNIQPRHKHMLKDFMTTLRKQELPEIALMFATKTVELAPDDDHAHFNLARIFYILERYKDAIAHLHKALELNNEAQDQEIYQKMLRYVENQQRRQQSPYGRAKR